jgi:acetyl-CoA carboxylase carboxyltransferase component
VTGSALPAPTLAPVPVAGRRSDAASAALTELDGRRIVEFRIADGKHVGAIGPPEGETLERAVRLAIELGVPIVGTIASSGADVAEGVSSLHAWGRVARALSDASGAVPTVLMVTGPAVSGPALLLGLADITIMTADAFAYVSGPDTVRAFTGMALENRELGGATLHGQLSGVASLVVDDEDDARLAAAHVLAYLPSNHLEDPPSVASEDPVDRDTSRASAAVPARATASYDVRVVIEDVLDDGSFFELRPGYAANLVTGLGHLDSHAVGVLANQPQQRAGTLDIDASEKAARFVQWCDCFNVPLITLVDTPGFEPGKDLEWRGLIRHGAELVHAYAAATVPRLCVVLRKAYGGAYIVMDSKGLGNDWCGAWPTAEVAVMGAPGAVQILHGRRLRSMDDAAERFAEQAVLEAEFDDRFSNPYAAAERGFVDEVLAASDTRRVLAAALDRLLTKREHPGPHRHANTPL